MNKPGTAMCHMDSPQGARNAIQYLHGQKLMGQTLELKYVENIYIKLGREGISYNCII